MKKSLPLQLSIIGFLWLCLTTQIYAQESAITGSVRDANGALPGVSIYFKNTQLGTITNTSGAFQIATTKTGEQTLVFSYIGYQSLEKQITIPAGENLDLGAISLDETVASLSEIVVKGTFLPSQIRALNLQKRANNIQNVIAADAIGKLPDRNAAEAVQRVPGVAIERDQGEGRFALVRGTPIEWSPNLINGDRLPSTDAFAGTRQTQLDIIPSELIEYVVVSKALTPDMEGDAIGGSINFKTRTAPSQRTLNASAAGGYNAQIEGASYNASLIYGDRIGDKFGFLLAAAVWNRPWASDNYELEYNFDQPGATGFSINNQQIRDYEGNRNTVGLNLAAQYDINDQNQLYVRGLYDVFEDSEFVRQHDFNFPEGPEEDPAVGSAQLLVRNADFDTQLYGGELGGEHYFNSKLKFDWKASNYRTEVVFGDENTNLPQDLSGIQITQFQQGGTFGGVSSDNYVYWGFDSPDGVGGSGEVFQPNFEQALNPQQFILTLAGVFQGESTEEDWVGQANFSYDISQRTKLKFGGKYRNKQRSSTQKSDFYVPLALFGAELPLQFYSDFEQEGYDTRGGVLQELGSPYEDILLENMMTEDALNGLLVNVYDNRDDYFATATAPNELTSFEGTENVAAAYAMAEINLSDNVLLTGGVRYEHTSLDLVGFELDTAGNLSRFEETPNYGSLLPMVNVKYQLSEDANLRLAYSRTLARPNFGNLNPTRTASNFGSNILLVSSGNPNLKPTYSNNFDLLGEYYFKDVGIASGGIFYKDLSNLIFNNLTQETIDGTTVRTSQPANLENAYLLGFELAFSKRLTFLPGFLSGFGIEANYTYTHSEVEVPVFNQETGEETVSEETLLNQPEHIYNLSLFYEKYGLTARIAANFKGDYIAEYRIEAGPEHYRFYGDNLTVDFSASYAFTNNFRIFAELNNITNEPLRYYHGTSARPEQIEFYSIRGQMGVRFSLF